MTSPQVKDRFDSIPKGVRIFMLKAVIIFIVWELLYNLLLKPFGIPNQFLTNLTTICTAKFLAIFYPDAQALLSPFKALITIHGQKVIGIADPCNALEIFVLYISFLFCFPANNKRRIIYTAIGVPAIFCINIIRCAAITWLNIEHRGWVDVSHHYIFTTLVYLMVFYLWVLFSKGGLSNEPKN